MERGFDVIQLDFNQNPQYIQRNAELLITLINDLNDQIDGNGQEIVVMGESMGAIVARYALTQMEYENANEGGPAHNVRLYVSLDGPHQGANVPWGLQYMAQDLVNEPDALAAMTVLAGGYNLVNFFTGALINLFSGGGSGGIGGVEAAFQLLRDSPIPLADVYAFDFRNNLNNIGNYPDDCRKIAISNGANTGAELGPLDYDGGFNVQNVNEGSTLLRVTLPIQPYISGNFQVYNASATPGITLAGIGSGLVYSKVRTTGIGSKFRFYLPWKNNWDVAPGGTYFRDRDIIAYKQHRFTFIPLVSGLDLDTDDPYFALNSVAGFGTTAIPSGYNSTKVMNNTVYTHSNAITPFDALWASQFNSYHVYNEGEDFLLEEIAPSILVVQNRTIDKNIVFEASNRVLIGNDLSPAFPEGDVVFEDGAEVEVWAGEEIYLQNGFHSQQGSEVHIYINNYDCQ